jgi:hypothetical protein
MGNGGLGYRMGLASVRIGRETAVGGTLTTLLGSKRSGFFTPEQLFIGEKGVEFDAGLQTFFIKGYFITFHRTVFAPHAPIKRTIHLFFPFFMPIFFFLDNDYFCIICSG